MSPMRRRPIAMMLTLLVVVQAIGCGQSVAEDVCLYNPQLDLHCPKFELRGADLSEANPTEADLFYADLAGAIRDGVIGADFSGALNVPAEYLKD